MALAGWSPDACLDFDLAVVWFGDWVDGRREEVEWVADASPPSGPRKAVPRYPTLAALLALGEDDGGSEPIDPAAFDAITRAFLAGGLPPQE